jgi:hypothetical protein
MVKAEAEQISAEEQKWRDAIDKLNENPRLFFDSHFLEDNDILVVNEKRSGGQIEEYRLIFWNDEHERVDKLKVDAFALTCEVTRFLNQKPNPEKNSTFFNYIWSVMKKKKKQTKARINIGEYSKKEKFDKISLDIKDENGDERNILPEFDKDELDAGSFLGTPTGVSEGTKAELHLTTCLELYSAALGMGAIGNRQQIQSAYITRTLVSTIVDDGAAASDFHLHNYIEVRQVLYDATATESVDAVTASIISSEPQTSTLADGTSAYKLPKGKVEVCCAFPNVFDTLLSCLMFAEGNRYELANGEVNSSKYTAFVKTAYARAGRDTRGWGSAHTIQRANEELAKCLSAAVAEYRKAQ